MVRLKTNQKPFLSDHRCNPSLQLLVGGVPSPGAPWLSVPNRPGSARNVGQSRPNIDQKNVKTASRLGTFPSKLGDARSFDMDHKPFTNRLQTPLQTVHKPATNQLQTYTRLYKPIQTNRHQNPGIACFQFASIRYFARTKPDERGWGG